MGTIREDYLKEMELLPKLSEDETIELYEQYLDGDQKVFEKLVNGNLYRVYPKVVEKNADEKIFMDAVQEGSYALLKVFTEKKPPAEDVMKEILKAIETGIGSVIQEENRAKSALNVFTEDLNKVSEAAVQFAKENGRAPKAEELAKIMGMDEGDVRCMLDLAFPNDSNDTDSEENDEKEEL